MEIWTYMKQISKFMDRDENSGQVQGPLVKFTLSKTYFLLQFDLGNENGWCTPLS